MNTKITESLEAIQSKKIQAIVERSALSFINLMTHKESELLETMQGIEEGKSLTISHSLILDLEKNSQKDRVSFSMKHQIEKEGQIPDPDQPELPNVDGGGE
jgi:hypothetical protein